MIFSQPGLGCDAGRAPPSQPRTPNPAPATNVTRQKSTYPPRGTVQTTGASSNAPRAAAAQRRTEAGAYFVSRGMAASRPGENYHQRGCVLAPALLPAIVPVGEARWWSRYRGEVSADLARIVSFSDGEAKPDCIHLVLNGLSPPAQPHGQLTALVTVSCLNEAWRGWEKPRVAGRTESIVLDTAFKAAKSQ